MNHQENFNQDIEDLANEINELRNEISLREERELALRILNIEIELYHLNMASHSSSLDMGFPDYYDK